jgi:NDP-sugar pyrophosphorylase family protein
MASVNGKPFLWYLLELLRRQGITDIVLCIGYLGAQLKDFFGAGDNFGLKITYSEEKENLMGTGGALKQAQNLLEDYCLVLNGDTYLPIDYREVERAYLKRGKKALTVVYANAQNTGVKNNLALAGDDMVIRYDKASGDSGLKYVEAGALIIQSQTFDLLTDEYPTSIETDLYPTLIKQRNLAAYITGQRFYDIGTPKQILVFEQFLKERVK